MAYHYRSVREVGAASESADIYNGPTAPLVFDLYDHFMRDRLEDRQYVESKGDQYWRWLERERQSNILRDYQDSIGIATNMFRLKNVFQDSSQAALTDVRVEANSYDRFRSEESPIVYDFYRYKDDEDASWSKLTRLFKKEDAALLDRVSSTVSNPYKSFAAHHGSTDHLTEEQIDDLYNDVPLMASGRIRLDINALLRTLKKDSEAQPTPDVVADELNSMLCVGLVQVAVKNAAKAKRMIAYGGHDAFLNRVRTIDQSAQDSKKTISKSYGSRSEVRDATRVFERRRAAVDKIKDILAAEPIIHVME